jgi:hypothetical protein
VPSGALPGHSAPPGFQHQSGGRRHCHTQNRQRSCCRTLDCHPSNTIILLLSESRLLAPRVSLERFAFRGFALDAPCSPARRSRHGVRARSSPQSARVRSLTIDVTLTPGVLRPVLPLPRWGGAPPAGGGECHIAIQRWPHHCCDAMIACHHHHPSTSSPCTRHDSLTVAPSRSPQSRTKPTMNHERPPWWLAAGSRAAVLVGAGALSYLHDLCLKR